MLQLDSSEMLPGSQKGEKNGRKSEVKSRENEKQIFAGPFPATVEMLPGSQKGEKNGRNLENTRYIPPF